MQDGTDSETLNPWLLIGEAQDPHWIRWKATRRGRGVGVSAGAENKVAAKTVEA